MSVKYDKFIKELYDREIIDADLKEMASSGNDELAPHFVYAGSYYQSERVETFKEMFMTAMKKIKFNLQCLHCFTCGNGSLSPKKKPRKHGMENLKMKQVGKIYPPMMIWKYSSRIF